MISARGEFDDGSTILVGLTFADVEFLREHPLDGSFSISGTDVGLPRHLKIRVVVAKDQAAFWEFLREHVDEKTVIKRLPEEFKN